MYIYQELFIKKGMPVCFHIITVANSEYLMMTNMERESGSGT